MASREYPSRPIVAVGGVVFIDDRVVLVKRRNEPLVGRWSLPGGAVEVGETLQEALRRELREELGIEVAVGPLIELTRRERGGLMLHVLHALGVLGGREAEAFLVTVAGGHSVEGVRSVAARIIGDLQEARQAERP